MELNRHSAPRRTVSANLDCRVEEVMALVLAKKHYVVLKSKQHN
jgi:hypothetical protein